VPVELVISAPSQSEAAALADRIMKNLRYQWAPQVPASSPHPRVVDAYLRELRSLRDRSGVQRLGETLDDVPPWGRRRIGRQNNAMCSA
jgi:hypothetical protein